MSSRESTALGKKFYFESLSQSLSQWLDLLPSQFHILYSAIDDHLMVHCTKLAQGIVSDSFNVQTIEYQGKTRATSRAHWTNDKIRSDGWFLKWSSTSQGTPKSLAEKTPKLQTSKLKFEYSANIRHSESSERVKGRIWHPVIKTIHDSQPCVQSAVFSLRNTGWTCQSPWTNWHQKIKNMTEPAGTHFVKNPCFHVILPWPLVTFN